MKMYNIALHLYIYGYAVTLQAPFNSLTYEIVGDDAASSFFRIDATSGLIAVSNNLENDGTRVYKIRVRALDGGTPQKTDTAVITVTMNRSVYSCCQFLHL